MPDERQAIAWSWRNLALGAVYAIPAAIVSVFDPALGLPLGVGVLPAAAIGLRSSRRERRLVIVVGTVAGVSMFVGSLVAPFPAAAVITIFSLSVAVALSVANPARRLAPLAMMLGLPLVGAGLSEPGPAAGAAAALLVSRPDHSLLRARGVERMIAVVGGAFVACGLAAAHPTGSVLAAVLAVMLAGAAATFGSRWYVLPFFSTVIVLSMLLLGETESAEHWFLERVGLTIAGVALAAGSAWLVPRLMRRAAGPREKADEPHDRP